MKAHILAAAFACTLVPITAYAQPITPPPQAAQGATPEQLLEGLIQHSRHTARIEDGRLTGEGAAFLRELGANSQFVIVGEQHGNAGIAQFATAYWRDLNAVGYNYAVSETDPWLTVALERELRSGGPAAWTRFMHANGGAMAGAFYGWNEEVAWANAVVQSPGAVRASRLWGFDQVFIGAAPWQMRDIAANARSAEARRLAEQLLETSEGNLNWFAGLDRAQLDALRATLNGRRDAGYAAMVDAMIVSHRIYQPFTGGGGEANLANTEREQLMRRLFLENYRRAEAADSAPPRVMMKMGASHAFRGASSTQTQGFGGFVTEFATMNGAQATTILALCAPGGQAAAAFGPPNDCANDSYRRNWAFIDAHIDPTAVTIFDLRIWRLRPRRWNMLPFDVQQSALSFDVLVFAPATPGSTLLPGLTQPTPPAN
ncbi:MAG TPA: hypothetical protein VFO00_04195 [Vitreimonas sp.]|nr:hypothetical protein [Vitreimonas sp.]